MIEVVSKFVVKEEAQGLFELAFGPGGAWSKLVAQAAGFRGTTLLRDTNHPRLYLMIDVWDTVEQREKLLAERKAEYADLGATMAGWTESMNEVGIFRVLGQAAVRPRGKGRRGGHHLKR